MPISLKEKNKTRINKCRKKKRLREILSVAKRKE